MSAVALNTTANPQSGSVFSTIARDKWVMEQFVRFHKTVLYPG